MQTESGRSFWNTGWSNIITCNCVRRIVSTNFYFTMCSTTCKLSQEGVSETQVGQISSRVNCVGRIVLTNFDFTMCSTTCKLSQEEVSETQVGQISSRVTVLEELFQQTSISQCVVQHANWVRKKFLKHRLVKYHHVLAVLGELF